MPVAGSVGRRPRNGREDQGHDDDAESLGAGAGRKGRVRVRASPRRGHCARHPFGRGAGKCAPGGGVGAGSRLVGYRGVRPRCPR